MALWLDVFKYKKCVFLWIVLSFPQKKKYYID